MSRRGTVSQETTINEAVVNNQTVKKYDNIPFKSDDQCNLFQTATVPDGYRIPKLSGASSRINESEKQRPYNKGDQRRLYMKTLMAKKGKINNINIKKNVEKHVPKR